MMTSQEQQQVTQDLQSRIWQAANALRNSGMEANDYRDYTLGLIFYKYESDRFLRQISEGLGVDFTNLDDAQATYEAALQDDDAKEVVDYVKEAIGFMIDPDKTFHYLVKDVHAATFQTADLAQALKNLEDSDPVFAGLFDDLDLNATKLGSTEQERNSVIGDVMSALDQINFAADTGLDVMGNAYEYLISQFQTESAKKAGEFYTPQAVSRLMMQIGMKGREDVQGVSVYDPAMGSGSLLLNAKRYNSHPDSIQYFGQEVKTAPYNLARMNMMLHDVPVSNQHLNLGNTLGTDWPSDEPTNFDIVTMNPPYSLSWKPTKAMSTDPRFQAYDVAPKSAADYAFLTHGLYHLKADGTMAIVLATGVLFRGEAEGRIRKSLLKKGNIEAVIGMPPKIFHNTEIPTVIIVLTKQRDSNEVLFVDATSEFKTAKKQNEMTDANLSKILDCVTKRPKYQKNDNGTVFARLVSYSEITDNDYNLNLPLYIDNFVPSPPVDVAGLMESESYIRRQEEMLNSKLVELLSTCTSHDSRLQKELQMITNVFTASSQSVHMLNEVQQWLQTNLLPDSNEQVPKIRVRGFDGLWKKLPLRELADRQTTKNLDGHVSIVLTNSAGQGVINQRDYFEKDIANPNSIKGYTIVQPDFFVYNPRISKRAPVGPFNRNSLGYVGIMSPLYTVFSFKNIDLDFLEMYLKSNKWHWFMRQNGNTGARSDRFAITKDLFDELPILVPEAEEQRAVALLLKTMDDRLKLAM